MMKIVNSDKAQVAIGPYIQAVDIGNLLFLSDQLHLYPITGIMAEDISAQAKKSLTNIKAILKAVNCQLVNIVKTTIFLAYLNDFTDVNIIYELFFMENNASFLARSCI